MSPAEESSARAPFSLELPDLGNLRITLPVASIPGANLRSLRLYIKNPYAERIDYGKIYTAINGEAANTIQSIRSARDGKIVTCDLESKPRFRLQPGKNVVEISAIDQDKRSFYASYVLIASGNALGDAATGVTIETSAVETGPDRQPPTIYMTAPKDILTLFKETDTLNVTGLVVDNTGAVDFVGVNGEPASLANASGERGLAHVEASESSGAGIAFARTITVGANTPAVVVEAKDKAGNLTRVVVPVRRREAAVSQQFKGRKYAVVIGISKYQFAIDGLNNLDFADADARAIRDFLKQPQGGNFAPADILYLENAEATILGVRSALDRFLPRAGPEDLIFLFIAGHGAPDPYAPRNLYFLMNDTKVADMPNTALPMSELQELLDNRVRAQRVVVFVDTCHSAGISGTTLVTGRQLVQTENNIFNLYAANLFREAGRAVLTSSDVNEISRESSKWGGGHGIFTWALLEGLRGDADANKDRLITAGELFDFVSNNVRIATAFRQNPRALPGLNKDFPLAVAK
ncbi:MAG TPA: caspase family protein [Pyrinomonadaceae bacterium]|nr:caspase family protein [Pyrinomonadaceae bacterium]